MVSNASYGSGRKTNPRRDASVGSPCVDGSGGIRETSAGLYLGVTACLALVKLCPAAC